MFSKELENLIKATLVDGKLEDYEKAALLRRAQNEGVDPTELSIYINSILQERERESKVKKEAEYAALDKAKKEAFGKVCPACGLQIPSLALNCICGYEFKKEKHKSSVEVFSDKLEKIMNMKIRSDVAYLKVRDEEERDRKLFHAISMFPVPNTKEDIMEFLALAAPKSRMKGGIFGTIPKRIALVIIITIILSVVTYPILPVEENMIMGLVLFMGFMSCIFVTQIDQDTLKWNKQARVWRAKFDQVMMKGRSLRADAEFAQMLDYYEKQVRK